MITSWDLFGRTLRQRQCTLEGEPGMGIYYEGVYSGWSVDWVCKFFDLIKIDQSETNKSCMFNASL